MKLLIANPPWRKDGRVGVRSGSRWPFTMVEPIDSRIPAYLPFPFYLAHAKSLLDREGFDAVLVDAVAEGMDMGQFLERVRTEAPAIVLMETSTPSFSMDLEIAAELKEIVDKVIFTGPHVTAEPVKSLEDNKQVDILLMGEFEPVLLELMKRLTDGKPYDDIPGLACRKADGTVANNGRAPQVKDVDWYPWPHREGLPMHHYRDAFAGMPEPCLQMWASRGCPYTCIFCVWPAVMYTPKTYRPRNPIDVADEMEWAVNTFDMKSVFFDDDTFNIGRGRMLKLASAIKEREINVPWAMMARADLVEDEYLEALVDSGLYAAKYGIESGSQDIVTRSSKNLDLKKAEKGIAITKKHGVKVHLTFSFGLPGETWDTVRQTIDYALKLDPETLQFSINTPFPGTPYYRIAQEQGTLSVTSTDDFDGWKSAVIRTETMTSSELEEALYIAREKWERAVMWRTIRRDPLASVKKVFTNPKRAVDIIKHRITTPAPKLPVGV